MQPHTTQSCHVNALLARGWWPMRPYEALVVSVACSSVAWPQQGGQVDAVARPPELALGLQKLLLAPPLTWRLSAVRKEKLAVGCVLANRLLEA